MEVLEPYQYRPCERANPQAFYVIASPITLCDNRAYHLGADSSFLRKTKTAERHFCYDTMGHACGVSRTSMKTTTNSQKARDRQSHLIQLVARIVLERLLMRRWQTTPSTFVLPLLGPASTHNPLDARQRCPIGVGLPLAKPHEDVTGKMSVECVWPTHPRAQTQ